MFFAIPYHSSCLSTGRDRADGAVDSVFVRLYLVAREFPTIATTKEGYTVAQIEFKDGQLNFESFDCVCGRHHELPIEQIIAHPGALSTVSETIDDLELGSEILLVTDENTFEAAGEAVLKQLRDSRRSVKMCLFPTRDKVKPDEKAIGHLLLSLDDETELLVVVGSGCLTDTTRLTSYRTGIPFVSVATAASMDGYASSGSPMTHGGYKQTFYANNPRAVIADTEVLAAAPQEMTSAGFGDTIAKKMSRIDWKLSKIVRSEYYCPVLIDLIDEAVDRCTHLSADVGRSTEKAVNVLIESLLISGMAMLIVGNSRPGSGSEHSLSYYWEMKNAMYSRKEYLHGTQVGVATSLMALFAQRFFSRDPSPLTQDEVVRNMQSLAEIEASLRKDIGPVADRVISSVSRPNYLDPDARFAEVSALNVRWREISELATLIPSVSETIDLLGLSKGAAFPRDIAVDTNYLRETLINAKEIRGKYTLLRAAETLGWLEEITEEVISDITGLEKNR